MKSKEKLIDEIQSKMLFLLKRSSIKDLENTLKEIEKSISKVKYIEGIVESWKENED
jgi:hypothetical protein